MWFEREAGRMLMMPRVASIREATDASKCTELNKYCIACRHEPEHVPAGNVSQLATYVNTSF